MAQVHRLRPAAQHDGTAGFSLVDMLVALLLLALMSGLMASFIGQFRAMQRIKEDTAARMELEAAVSHLKRSIAGAMLLPFIESAPDERRSFEGSATGLRYTTIARQGAHTFGLRETTIELKEGGGTRSLMQSFHPRRLNPGQREAAAMTVELMQAVDAVTFRYLTHESGTKTPIWSDDWKDRSDLPAAVGITLEAPRNGQHMVVEGRAILGIASGGQPDPVEGSGL